MTPRSLSRAAAVLALASAASVAFLDVRLARALATLPAAAREVFGDGTGLLDLLTGKELSNAVLGLALIGLALVAWFAARRWLAKLLVLVAACNVLAHLSVSVLKPVFGRLRPYQIADAGWSDRFFAGGSSFPSGHTAFYFGLCLPLAWALPRWRLPLLVPALFIALARPVTGHHFAGDVLGALALTCAVCACLIAAFRRRARLEPFGRELSERPDG